MSYGSTSKQWCSHDHMTCGSRTPSLSSSNCTNCGVTFSCWMCNTSTSCRRCGYTFCKRCCDRTARLTLWGYANNLERVCSACHRDATLENDLLNRYLPMLLRGEVFKKHGTLLVTKVRVKLHPSCRRLEYWKPPSILIRDQASEVKGIDVPTLRGVFDASGMRIRVVGIDKGYEKTMHLESVEGRAKTEWLAGLKLLCSMKSIVSSPDFARIIQQTMAANSSNNASKNNWGGEKRSRQKRDGQNQQAEPSTADIENAERRSKWQERREARAAKRESIAKKYGHL
jgi:hypothetical protein